MESIVMILLSVSATYITILLATPAIVVLVLVVMVVIAKVSHPDQLTNRIIAD